MTSASRVQDVTSGLRKVHQFRLKGLLNSLCSSVQFFAQRSSRVENPSVLYIELADE